jgi:2-polyprenyl-6-hydroxyphenyl methylase/3-demethylubiquinone-9 3-methyltransferase
MPNMTANRRYYSDHLSAERLRRCYELAPPRVRQYLEAEIEHVLDRISPTDVVLELGCGYGRVLGHLAGKAKTAVGIDNAQASLALASKAEGKKVQCHLAVMDAGILCFRPGGFDVVVCIQNGISAFKVDPQRLLTECIRVAKPRGLVLLSSYAETFWAPRLKWFELQAAHGLLGEIDTSQTGHGVIVCKDGFRATTFRPADFHGLCASLSLVGRVTEVDASSLFCEIRVPG